MTTAPDRTPRKRSRFLRFLAWAFLACLVLGLAAVAVVGVWYFSVSSKLPDVETLRHVELQEPLYIYAADGRLMGIFGGYFIGVVMIGLDHGSYWSQMQAAVDLRDDVLNGVIKSLVFGVAVTLIAVFEGYDAQPTAAGVSAATTRTVVTSALVILALDFVLTAFMF